MNPIFRPLLCALLLGASGCYSYVAVPVESAPVGVSVRARISPAEAERLRDVLGREDRVLQGELLGTGNGEVLLQVPAAFVSTGASLNALNQRVSIPHPALVELEIRRLDRWKTAGMVAVAAAAVTYAAIEAFGGDSSPTGERPGGEQSIIGLRWSW